MSSSITEARTESPELLGHLKRYFVSAVMVALLIFGLSMLSSMRQTPEYESSATLLLRSGQQGGQPSTINLETEKQLIGSAAVAELVVEKLNLRTSPEEIRIPLQVDSPSDTEILVITYTHPDRVMAQRITQAFADSYIEFRRSEALADQTQTAGAIDEELQVLNSRLDQINRQLAGGGANPPAGLQGEANLVLGLILERQLDKLKLSASPRVGEIVQRAGIPTKPSSPNHLSAAVMGLFAGSIIGAAQAVLRGRFSKKIIKPQLVESILDAPVLAAIPARGMRAGKGAHPLATLSQKRTDTSEAYEVLRANVLAHASADDLQILMVGGVSEDEDGLLAAANLAVSAAQAEKRTIFLSVDLQSLRLSQLMNVKKGRGLVDILSGKASLEEVLTPGPVSNLQVLRGGETPTDRAKALGSQTMPKLIADLRRNADLVIIHVPLVTTAESVALTPLVDGVLLSIREGAKQDGVVAARRLVSQVGGQIVGATFEEGRQRPLPPIPATERGKQRQGAPDDEGSPREPAIPPSQRPIPGIQTPAAPPPTTGVRLIDRHSNTDSASLADAKPHPSTSPRTEGVRAPREYSSQSNDRTQSEREGAPVESANDKNKDAWSRLNVETPTREHDLDRARWIAPRPERPPEGHRESKNAELDKEIFVAENRRAAEDASTGEDRRLGEHRGKAGRFPWDPDEPLPEPGPTSRREEDEESPGLSDAAWPLPRASGKRGTDRPRFPKGG